MHPNISYIDCLVRGMLVLPIVLAAVMTSFFPLFIVAMYLLVTVLTRYSPIYQFILKRPASEE